MLALTVAAFLPLFLGLSQKDLEAFGYPGVFLANLLGNTVIPAPGFTAIGQGLVVALGRTLNPLAVALTAAIAMTVAESTLYLGGRLGRDTMEGPVQGRLGQVQAMRRVAATINRLMLHYGFVTLLLLSALPNPFLEVAGLAAGAVRMQFFRFLLPVGIGKTIRALILAYLGNALGHL